MVQDVLSSGVSGVTFDLLSQEGVMRALQYVRASAGSPLEKRELRDLIFSYTNTGGDPALRTLIEQRLTALPVVTASAVVPNVATTASVTQSGAFAAGFSDVSVSVPLPIPIQTKPIPVTTFGVSRPTPQFAVVTPVAAKPVIAPQPVNVTSTVAQVHINQTPVVPLMQDSSPVLTSPINNVPAVPVAVPPLVPPITQLVPEPLPPLPPLPPLTPTPIPVAPVAFIPVPEEMVSPVPVPNESPVPPLSVPSMLVGVAQPVSPEDMIERYRARIAEIKQSVNSQVGNPVNLINLNREVGSNYMTNLLAAMKAMAGASGDPVATMRALEDSYKEVSLLFTSSAVVPETAVQTVSTNDSVVTPEPLSGFTAAFTSEEVPVTPIPVISPLSIERREIGPIPAHTPTIQPVVPVAPDTAVATVPITSTRMGIVAPVAQVTPLKTPQDLPTAAQKKAELGITDPLLDPDVDTGLDQLLSEWAIFKKSGMFGTGPRGRQHPLFQKLGPVNMVLIVSGRFEGVTSEIRQSITDYMNGWRYEQGITYENDEDFEHYLRRVVRHILDLQSNRRRS